MNENSAPHAGKRKRWWTRAEALKWILYRGFPNRLPSNATALRIVVERAAKQHLAVDSKTRFKFGGLYAAKANNALLKAKDRELLRVKEDGRGDASIRYNVQDVKRLFPSPSGPGSGRPKRELLPRREVMALARHYAASKTKLSREVAAQKVFGIREDGGAIGNDRFQVLRRAALNLATADARAGLFLMARFQTDLQPRDGVERELKGGALVDMDESDDKFSLSKLQAAERQLNGAIMVKVHHFKAWNNIKGDWEIPPSKRTAERIAELKGEIIPNTAEEVDVTKLDGHGRYFSSGAAVQMEKTIDMGTLKRKPK